MEGAFFADTLTLCADAQAVLRYLVDQDEGQQFAIATQARITCLLQQPALFLRGQAADAVIASLPVQGVHRLAWDFLVASFCDPELRELPDFLIYIDAAAWQSRGLVPAKGPSGHTLLREALIFHELLHLRQMTTPDGDPRFHRDGREMLALRRHTYEFFQEEITRYGPTTLGLEQVGLDFVAGHKQEIKRDRPQLRRVK